MALIPYNYNQLALAETDEDRVTDATPRLNLERLLATRRHINHQRNKVYKEVLRLCHKRIEFEACRRTDQTWCIYQIPLWVPGLPRFDTAACTRYCIAKLRENGLDTTLLPPFTLHISWQRVEDKALRRARKSRERSTAGLRTSKLRRRTADSLIASARKKTTHLDAMPPCHSRSKPPPRPPAFLDRARRRSRPERVVRFAGTSTEGPYRPQAQARRHWPRE